MRDFSILRTVDGRTDFHAPGQRGRAEQRRAFILPQFRDFPPLESQRSLRIDAIYQQSCGIHVGLRMNDIELLNLRNIEGSLAAVSRNIGNISVGVRGILMKDAETLRTTDIDTLEHRVPRHVVIDIGTGFLPYDLTVGVEDIEDPRVATSNKDGLGLLVDRERRILL